LTDAKTLWLFREQLTRTGAISACSGVFEAVLRDAGYLAMAGQIVDATAIQARRARLTSSEKGGGVPEGWAKRAQMDTDGRWTIKRGRKRSAGDGGPKARVAAPIAVPVFGDKNHPGIDRRHGFIRRFAVMMPV
jgi:IS5 family transposase